MSPRLGTLLLTQGQTEPGTMAGAELGQHHREGAAAKDEQKAKAKGNPQLQGKSLGTGCKQP